MIAFLLDSADLTHHSTVLKTPNAVKTGMEHGKETAQRGADHLKGTFMARMIAGKRRNTLVAALAFAIVALVLDSTLGQMVSESTSFAARRQELTQRPRRIIYNNDDCDVFPAGADTPKGFLSQRMNAVLNSQVDSVFYCTGATTMFSHDAAVGEIYGKYDIDEEWAQHAAANIAALKKQNTDALRLAIEFCHQNDKEIFFTHRINDIHDSFTDWELSTWKREHPE